MADQNISTKPCPGCGEKKPLTMDFWYRKAGRGWQGKCKSCQKEYSRQRAESGPKAAKLRDRSELELAGRKRCNLCNAAKLADEFYKKAGTYDGLQSRCISCERHKHAENKRRRSKNYREYLKKRQEKDDLSALGMKKCSSCLNAQPCEKEFFSSNTRSIDGLHSVCRACDAKRARKWYELNSEQARENRKNYVSMNKERVSAEAMRWRNSSPKNLLTHRVRSAILKAFRANGYTKKSRTHEILGCDWVFFMTHIERQFAKGMTWENRGDWHIDHIIPMASAKNEEDVIRLNHHTNLRPMWAKDNLSKGARRLTLL